MTRVPLSPMFGLGLFGCLVVSAASKPVAEYRGLLIGVSAYRSLPRLIGATADARDLEVSLKSIGTRDLRVVIDGAATRRLILSALQDLVARSQAGDTVFLVFSGYGARASASATGSEPDDIDRLFLLPNFDPAAEAQNGESLSDKEIKNSVLELENKGAQVILVMDACFGEELAREVDPRARPLVYRCVSPPSSNVLQPVSPRPVAATHFGDLRSTTILAAGDIQSKVPEVQIPGIGQRGALSYSVARGLQGAADLDRDGTITGTELCEYARRVTYQLSDQRQRIFTAPAQQGVLKRRAAHPSSGSAAGLSGSGAKLDAGARSQADAVLIASLDGSAAHFAGLSVQAPFRVVELNTNPDLVWDPANGDVLSGGDVIARAVDRNDLPIIIERAALLRWLKQRAQASPLALRIAPDDRLHRKGSRIEVEVADLASEGLVMFNIASDGTVELLYPIGSDPPVALDRQHRLVLQVRAPFGADQIVAVSSPRRMPELEQALRQLDRKRSPLKARDALAQAAGPDSRIGSAGLFTAP